ncbi:hypothetical protein [Bacillus massiliglaciei]|uniref:hypothetical protein n=1 Tax=Bacillus massiliglaciei TaxID=1816693 RepID=UPI0018FE7DE7|nr:hypothetical protein [Bacillus massiliglaciei]
MFALWFLIIPPIVAFILIIQRNKELKTHQNIWSENNFDEMLNNKERLRILNEEIQKLTFGKQKHELEIEEYQSITNLTEVKDKIAAKIDTHNEKSEMRSKQVGDIRMLIDFL